MAYCPPRCTILPVHAHHHEHGLNYCDVLLTLSPSSGCVLHPCGSRGGHCAVTQCVSCLSRHWPACQDGCVFKEPWTSTSPMAWRPWGCWSSHWPSLPYTSSGQWYVQGLCCPDLPSLFYLAFSNIKCNPAKCKGYQPLLMVFIKKRSQLF